MKGIHRGSAAVLRSTTGSTMMFVVCLLPLVFMVGGLMVDAGVYLLARQRLGSAADAGAIKGAQTFQGEVLWQGDETLPCPPDLGSTCDADAMTTCWQIWTHRVDSVDAESTAREFAAVNYPDGSYTVTTKKLSGPTSELRIPSFPGEKPAGVARWRVIVEGHAQTPLYFVRMINVSEASISAYSAVTWEKNDEYRSLPGFCPP